MYETTERRHENLRAQIDQRAENYKREGRNNYVKTAITEIAKQSHYSESYLRRIYYDY